MIDLFRQLSTKPTLNLSGAVEQYDLIPAYDYPKKSQTPRDRGVGRTWHILIAMEYLWVDGIHVNIRLAEHKLCLLVMIGVRADVREEADKVGDRAEYEREREERP